MIVATLATYPPRQENLLGVIQAVAPQVDQLNIVLNEFQDIPAVCSTAPNIIPIIPEKDTKDTGKFLPTVATDDWLFTIDDDLYYPPDYVAKSLASLKAVGDEKIIGGYHGSIYRKHRYLNSRLLRRLLRRNPNFIVSSRDIIGFSRAQTEPVFVDQLGTGVCVMRGCDAPHFEYVAHGQRFVDVAAAKYWFEAGCSLVSLPRAEKWIEGQEDDETSIISSFTHHTPKKVADEIYAFAFKNPRIGR